MRNRSLVAGLAALALAAALPAVLASGSAAQAAQGEIVWKPVPGPGKKCPIDDAYYFKYEFNEKPKMGMSILKIQVFDKKNDQVVPFKATGRSDMPSMRGAHDSGDVEFRLNKKNDYLLPVNVVMPGDWEIRLIFWLNGKPVFHGSIRFDV
ncbi:MAG: hypothetical protein NTZ26_05340 [Candidatus Aminicenantes bacterium]|nr:hypothetical protein [Candidatus Aminicenantes bacterium]